MISKQFTLRFEDYKSIGRGLLVAVAGAIAVYLTNSMGDIFGTLKIPVEYLPIATAIAGVIVNALRKYSSETKY